MNPIHQGRDKTIQIGVSSCLLGNHVRYDGGDQYDACIAETLQELFTLVGYCPEVAIGMGVPRPPIHLVSTPIGTRSMGVEDANLDVTGKIQDYITSVQQQIQQLDGFIFKSRSPSCGIEKVKLFRGVQFDLSGHGIFAAAIRKAFPVLPVIEESGLGNRDHFRNFLQRVQVHHRWAYLQQNLTPETLVAFHTDHKFLLLAHSESHYRKLGQLISRSGPDFASIQKQYISRVMDTLKIPSNRKKQANVFMHMLGYLKKRLPTREKRNLLDEIVNFRSGKSSATATRSAFIRILEEYPDEYLERQHFLAPLPGKLMEL